MMTQITGDGPRFVCATFLLICAGCIFGCSAVDNAEGDAQPARSVAQDLLGRTYWAWRTTDGPDYDTGLFVSTNTCFLSGVAGNLTSSPGSIARAEVVQGSNGHWWLRARGAPGSHHAVEMHATCVGVGGNRPVATIDFGSGSSAPTVIAPATPSRRCLLTGVWGGSASGRLGYFDEYIALDPDGIHTNWQLDVEVFGPDPSVTGASAICFDLPAGAHEVVPALVELDVDNDVYKQYLQLETTSPVSCGLIHLDGCFADGRCGSESALIDPAPAGGGFWTLTVRHKQSLVAARAHCFW